MIHVPDENVMFTKDCVEYHSACYCGDGHFADWGQTLDNIASFDVDAIAPGSGDALVGKDMVNAVVENTRDFVESTYRAAVGDAARSLGVISVVDNSWATPIFQNPASLGIDLIVHAASKYLSGHSDTLGGLVAGPKEVITRIDQEATHLFGGRMSPMDAFLVLRGMRTLELRMNAHMDAGLTLARRLADHPLVTAVHHPGLRDARPDGLSGFGGLFAFDLAEGIDVERFCNALRVIRIGVSWGGPESLIVPGQAACGLAGAANSFRRFGVSPRTVRRAVGLEPVAALEADLRHAISAAQAVAA